MDAAQISRVERTREVLRSSIIPLDAQRDLERLLDAAHEIVNGGSNDLSKTNLALSTLLEYQVARCVQLSKIELGCAIPEEKTWLAVLIKCRWAIATLLGVIAFSPHVASILEFVKGFL